MFLTILLSLLLSIFSFADATSYAGAAPVTVGGVDYTPLPGAIRDLYSREILFQAQPRLRFAQFAKIKRDFQAVRGKSIIFTKYNNLDGGGSIAETAKIGKRALGTDTVSISVTEQANAVQVTELALQQSLHDIMGDASRVLANNAAKSIDTQLRDTCLSTTNVLYGSGKVASPAALGALDLTTAADAEQALFTTSTVRQMVEELATNDAPRIQGEFYVCFAHPHQLRHLREDKDWIEANKYMGRRQIYVGEVGMFEGMIFIETTQMPTYTAAEAVTAGYTGAVGTDNFYAAVAFGENAFGWGIALDIELRDDGIQDFGRMHGLAWYGIWGSGILEEKNVFKVLTK